MTDNNSQKDAKYKKIEVVKFDMEFSNMVSFMVKWAIASIPAMIILILIIFFILSLIGGLPFAVSLLT